MHSHPKAPDTATEAAWAIARMRRRMLEGDWREDLNRRIREMAGPVKQAFWGDGDPSKNLAKSIIYQLSTIYDVEGKPSNEDTAATDAMSDVLKGAGYWELMQGAAPLIIGQREGLTRAEVVDRNGEPALLVRTVPADLVFVRSHPDNPDVPTVLGEYRPRMTEKGAMWVADVFDISDPASPVFRTLDEDGNPIDVGVPTIAGAEYLARWSYSDGRPFIPGEWRHASRTGKLRDPKFGSELFHVSLTVSAYWTLFSHIIVDCSHPQRWTVGLQIQGLAADEGAAGQYVITDPSSVLQFGAEPGVPGSIGQWQPGGDPVVIGNAIRDFSSDSAVEFGISSADIQRASGDARSGFAIYLSREGQRKAQRKYKPSFERGDRSMIGKIAAMLNRSAGMSLPETGWDVHYAGLPLGIQEQAEQQSQIDARLAAGTISKVDAVMQTDHISRAAAVEKLRRVEEERRLFP